MFKKVFQTLMIPTLASIFVVGCATSTQAMEGREEQTHMTVVRLYNILNGHNSSLGKDGHSSVRLGDWNNLPQETLMSSCSHCNGAYVALKGLEEHGLLKILEEKGFLNGLKRSQKVLPKPPSLLQRDLEELQVRNISLEERLKESEALVSALMAEIEGLSKNSLGNEKLKTEKEVDEELVETVQNLYNYTGEQIKEEEKTKEVIKEMMQLLGIDTANVEDQKGSILAALCLARLKNLEK